MKSKKIKYLTTSQIFFIHDQLIKEFGGSHGLRDANLLESAVSRPKANFDGRNLYNSLFDKAAALMQSILKNHSFLDGNKRTALSSAAIFLKTNGWNLKNTHNEEVKFAVEVDTENLSIEQISKWLKDNSLKN